MKVNNVDPAKAPWIGPSKFKIENLPYGLYNTRERTHLTLSLEESLILLTIVMQVNVKEMMEFTEITESDLSSTIKNLENKFNILMKEHNFDKKGCFAKLSGVSSKDIVVKPVRNFNEFIRIIVGSQRILGELHKAIFGQYMNLSPLALPIITEENYDPVSIIMSEWVNTDKFVEFRTFIIDGKTCFISQYNWWEYYSQIEKDPNLVVNSIDEIILDYKSRNWLIDNNMVADFWLDEDLKNPKFIEFNPYQSCDPCLFKDKNSICHPGLPIETYRAQQGCFRFIGRIDNGFESIPIDDILNKELKSGSIEELEKTKKALLKKRVDPDYLQGLDNAIEIQKLRKMKTLGISQSRF